MRHHFQIPLPHHSQPRGHGRRKVYRSLQRLQQHPNSHTYRRLDSQKIHNRACASSGPRLLCAKNNLIEELHLQWTRSFGSEVSCLRSLMSSIETPTQNGMVRLSPYSVASLISTLERTKCASPNVGLPRLTDRSTVLRLPEPTLKHRRPCIS